MKKYFAGFALAGILIAPAMADIKTLGCEVIPSSGSTKEDRNYSLTFNSETGEARLQGLLSITPRIYPTYRVTPAEGSDNIQHMTLTVKGKKDTDATADQIGIYIDSEFSIPAGKDHVQIDVAETSSHILCPVPTRAFGLD